MKEKERKNLFPLFDVEMDHFSKRCFALATGYDMRLRCGILES